MLDTYLKLITFVRKSWSHNFIFCVAGASLLCLLDWKTALVLVRATCVSGEETLCTSSTLRETKYGLPSIRIQGKVATSEESVSEKD